MSKARNHKNQLFNLEDLKLKAGEQISTNGHRMCYECDGNVFEVDSINNEGYPVYKCINGCTQAFQIRANFLVKKV